MGPILDGIKLDSQMLMAGDFEGFPRKNVGLFGVVSYTDPLLYEFVDTVQLSATPRVNLIGNKPPFRSFPRVACWKAQQTHLFGSIEINIWV